MLDWFSAKDLTAYSISCGNALLYNNIFPKHTTRLGQKVSELVGTVAKVSSAAHDCNGHIHPWQTAAVPASAPASLPVPVLSAVGSSTAVQPAWHVAGEARLREGLYALACHASMQ